MEEQHAPQLTRQQPIIPVVAQQFEAVKAGQLGFVLLPEAQADNWPAGAHNETLTLSKAGTRARLQVAHTATDRVHAGYFFFIGSHKITLNGTFVRLHVRLQA